MSLAEQRGRQPGHVVSTGRGGAGNLVAHPVPDDDSLPGAERGRELSPHPRASDHVTHSGRGGAGNIRPSSHSRTREDIKQEAEEEALQEQLIADARGRQAEQAFSTGRGGVGNISRSRSRSKARTSRGESSTRREGSALGLGRRTTRDTVTTGRGGFGNISEEKEKNSIELEKETARNQYEANVLAKYTTNEAAHPHAYATGKGGAGNVVTPAPRSVEPDIAALSLEGKEERDAHAKVHANETGHWVPSGRGGAGNMHHRISDNSHSPAPDERGRDAHKGGVLGNVLRSFSRAAGRDKSSEGRAKD
ncbi:cytoplasmic protein [Cryptococcus neoformans]|nr:cytoplasmic protein [Cryptococcus neoformans var. grubii]